MSIVCPTVTAYTTDEYREQIEAIEPFAERAHLDVGDGKFTKKTVAIADLWWPGTMTIDVHLMCHNPEQYLPELIAKQPDMVIIHAEANGDLEHFMRHMAEHGIACGVALLQGTSVKSAEGLIRLADHVLIFSGSLGSFGGVVDFGLLAKVAEVRALKGDIEVGWDGGISAANARDVSRAGIDVLNVGGAIQKAVRPENAYRDIVRRLDH